MPGRLSGKVCFVTGSTGIGEAAAVRFAAEGASVFVASRTEAHLVALARRVEAAGGSVAYRAAELTDPAEVEAAVIECVRAFGRVDCLLSVAGGSGRRFGDGPVHALTPDSWDRTIELNLRSQALVCGAVVRQLLAQPAGPSGGRGAIVLVSSVLATHPAPELFATHAYAASKGAIDALSMAMAATYARDGIRVNTIAPGLTATQMAARAAADPVTVAFAARKQPLSAGFIEAGDVAEAAVYLLGDESRAVTGQVLAIDGGWSVVAAEGGVP